MVKALIWKTMEGGIATTVPTISFRNLTAGLTEDQILDLIQSWSVPAAVPAGDIKRVDAANFPKDKEFREAWVLGQSSVDVDMPKARIIHMDRIRKVRDEELDKSDKELMMALENGDNLTALKARRKNLREIPQTFDLELAQTAGELKVMWPADLPQPQV